MIGSVDRPLLGSLLVGSVPGIVIGNYANAHVRGHLRDLADIVASNTARSCATQRAGSRYDVAAGGNNQRSSTLFTAGPGGITDAKPNRAAVGRCYVNTMPERHRTAAEMSQSPNGVSIDTCV